MVDTAIRATSRREFISSIASAGVMTACFPCLVRASDSSAVRSVININLVGGPSSHETFDPKPLAPSDVRGPFRAIPTAAPGIHLSETLPKLARRGNRFALIRSMCHGELPIHETGLQLLQTGILGKGDEPPHFGSVVAGQCGSGESPAWVGIPGPLTDTGVPIYQGQSGGTMGLPGPVWMNPSQWGLTRPSRRFDYGKSSFGEWCRLAVDLVARGVRVVTINMYAGVFDQLSWDMHGSSRRLFVSPGEYKKEICPTFDAAMAGLLDDLHATGLSDQVLVVAVGEMGRSPRMNSAGGRDHWTRCWSALVAGGGIQGGAVLGASDSWGGEPIDRPVSPAELMATIYDFLGIQPAGPLASHLRAQPLRELFA